MVAVLTLVLASCGTEASGVTVLAAASLTEAFERLEDLDVVGDLDPSFSFAGSPTLVEQVRQGAPADVIAVADRALLRPLEAGGLLDGEPVLFARNPLVVVVSEQGARRVRSLSDLATPGVRVALGAQRVPVGRLARELLEAEHLLDAVLDNAVTFEPDVTGVVGKVKLGEADAGIVYASDAAVDGLRVVAGPFDTAATYAAAVVADARAPDAARRFVEVLDSGAVDATLEGAGLQPTGLNRRSEAGRHTKA